MRLLVLEPSRWSLVSKYQALVEGVSVEDLLAFSRELKEQLYAEGLVQGNLTSTVRTLARYPACTPGSGLTRAQSILWLKKNLIYFISICFENLLTPVFAKGMHDIYIFFFIEAIEYCLLYIICFHI